MNTTTTFKNVDGAPVYYIDIKKGNTPDAAIWREILEAFEGSRADSLYSKTEAWMISNLLQPEAVAALRRRNPKAKQIPQFVPVWLPF